jgi:mannan polymerase II complex MNN10 subunit
MEPSISLQQHLFNDLNANTYRDINHYNPLNISHPPDADFLDPISASPSGDNQSSSIDVLISQDCGGFNLGSFFMRRSPFTERLLDTWWDPVLYEQKHMEWEHKEQDALEHLYASQPYARSHIAFVEQRKINSFPPGACSPKDENGVEQKDQLDPKIHYNEKDRDFLVNMAGCEWGRDCWGEIYHFRELSYSMNKGRWESFVDAVRAVWKNFKKDWFEGGEQKKRS